MGTNFLVLLFFNEQIGGNNLRVKNVYIGRYKKNNRETLFCKRAEDQYEDLKKEGQIVSLEEIHLDSLIPYEDVFQTGNKDQMKHTIIRSYNNDRGESINLSRVYIGDVYQVTEIVDRKFVNHQKQRKQSLAGSDCHTLLKGDLVKKGALLINFGEILKGMEQPFKIKHNQYPEVGQLIVIENNFITLMSASTSVTEKLRPFTSLIPMEEEKAPKRKILKKYWEYRDEQIRV